MIATTFSHTTNLNWVRDTSIQGHPIKKFITSIKFFVIFLFVHLRKLALVSSSLVDQQQQLCNHYQFWTKSQRSLCLQFTDLIPKVAEGAEMAYGECR